MAKLDQGVRGTLQLRSLTKRGRHARDFIFNFVFLHSSAHRFSRWSHRIVIRRIRRRRRCTVRLRLRDFHDFFRLWFCFGFSYKSFSHSYPRCRRRRRVVGEDMNALIFNKITSEDIVAAILVVAAAVVL